LSYSVSNFIDIYKDFLIKYFESQKARQGAKDLHNRKPFTYIYSDKNLQIIAEANSKINYSNSFLFHKHEKRKSTRKNLPRLWFAL